MTTGAQIYIGGLKGEVMPEDLKYEFKKFGSITEFSYKGRYAFIEYEAADSASRAIKEMDDQRVAPSRVRITVEAASKCKDNISHHCRVFCSDLTPIFSISFANPFSCEKIETAPRGGGADRGGRGGDRSPRGRGPSPSDKCYRCNRTGHW